MLVIDEAQRVPGLILPLKAEVDRDRRSGRFLLTGSADLLPVKGVGDSLAGRAESMERHVRTPTPWCVGAIPRPSDVEASAQVTGSTTTPNAWQTTTPASCIRAGSPIRWANSYR